MKTKGIIVKIKGSSCIALAKDGTYHKVPLSGHKNARVGAEIEFSSLHWFSYMKPALMVASLLIAMLGFTLYKGALPAEAFAYVSLDINPSVELVVNKDLKVVSANSMNDDAKRILSTTNLKGSDLYFAVNKILAESLNKGYLKAGQKNYILSTVTVKDKTLNMINYDSIAKNLEKAVNNKNFDVEIVVMSTDLTLRSEAKSRGLSTGKYAVYKDTVASGDKVTLNQVRQNSITQLVKVYKVKFSPDNRKHIIKTMHVPLRKQHPIHDSEVYGSKQENEDITIDSNQDRNRKENQSEQSGNRQNQGNNKRNNDEKDNRPEVPPGQEIKEIKNLPGNESRHEAEQKDNNFQERKDKNKKHSAPKQEKS